MPNDAMEKIKKAFMKTQTLAAKVFGTPRVNVMKTEKMSEKILNGYAGECEELINLAKIAKDIEESANTGELTKVARVARKCKINIKSEFEKFVKEMSRTDGDIKLSSGHLDTSKGEIKELLTKMRKPVASMLEIYNTCVNTYNNLDVSEKAQPITPETAPSAPPIP